jgi:hypothetical protein
MSLSIFYKFINEIDDYYNKKELIVYLRIIKM